MNNKMNEKTHVMNETAVDHSEEVWSKGDYNGFSRGINGSQTTPFMSSFVKHIRKINSNQARIMEFGAGTGEHAIALIKEGFTVSAIESSQTAVSLMKKKVEKENINLNIRRSKPAADF